MKWVFSKCSLHVLWVCSEWSLNDLWVISEWSLESLENYHETDKQADNRLKIGPGSNKAVISTYSSSSLPSPSVTKILISISGTQKERPGIRWWQNDHIFKLFSSSYSEFGIFVYPSLISGDLHSARVKTTGYSRAFQIFETNWIFGASGVKTDAIFRAFQISVWVTRPKGAKNKVKQFRTYR